jgi:hypothetical protein
VFTEAKKPFVDTTKRTTPVTVTSISSDRKDTSTTIKPIIEKPKFVPSYYVYTNKEGYVYINLPDADRQKYRVRFYEEDDSFLFEIKSIKETGLTLDKTNFIHAGWFRFELYNDEKLIEKNKFYLAKDF